MKMFSIPAADRLTSEDLDRGLFLFPQHGKFLSVCNIRYAKKREASIKAEPENNIAHELITFDNRYSAERNEGNLDEL
jgi:hypothetical protein